MGLKVSQDYNYKGDDWWEWAMWIEGSESELDQIRHVVYTLHPTFPNPVRTISDRRTKFRLETAGWGTFRIQAKIIYKSGEKVFLEHDLLLAYPGGAPSPK